MSRDLRHYLNQPYTIRVVPDCGTFGEQLYFASVAELPGCDSHGETPEAALRNVRDAMSLYIASMLEDGIFPPEPEEHSFRAVWSVRPQSHHPHLPQSAQPRPDLVLSNA